MSRGRSAQQPAQSVDASRGTRPLRLLARTLPPSRVVSAGLRRFDHLFNGIIGAFGLLYGLQTTDSFIADLPSSSNPTGVIVITLVATSVVTGLIAVVTPARARIAFVTGAALYALALLLWPLAMEPPVPTDPMPWLVAMWPVAAAFLAQGTALRVVPVVIATLFSAFTSLVLHLRGGLAPADAAVNGLFMTGTALVLVLLLGTVRRGVVIAARKQQVAVDRFAATKAEDATEEERKRTDALLHDAVLTTFLSAAVASTPESEDLVSRMAANSLRVLMHVNGVGRDEAVLPFGRALADERDRFAPLVAHFSLDVVDGESIMLPETVARAVVNVMLNVMRTSHRHTDAASRRVVRAGRLGPDGIRVQIEVNSATRGPEPAMITTGDRDHLRAVEARVDVHSTDDSTRVVLSWGSVAIVGTTPLDAGTQVMLP